MVDGGVDGRWANEQLKKNQLDLHFKDTLQGINNKTSRCRSWSKKECVRGSTKHGEEEEEEELVSGCSSDVTSTAKMHISLSIVCRARTGERGPGVGGGREKRCPLIDRDWGSVWDYFDLNQGDCYRDRFLA